MLVLFFATLDLDGFSNFDFNVYLCATKEELEEEMEWACSRKSSRAVLGRSNPDDYENRFRNS